MVHIIFKRIAKSQPQLPLKLNQAGIVDTPEVFIKKTITTAVYMSAAMVFIIFGFTASLPPEVKNKIAGFFLIMSPFMALVLYAYFARVPDMKILKRERGIQREIVFAGRFLIIELQSGVPLYDAMNNISLVYPEIGKMFKDVIVRIDFGTPILQALNESLELTPSDDFRKILWQIASSIRTGADISQSLENVLKQIIRKQIIEINKYGKKLSPLAMFYMMLAVILPSIGITMLIVFSTFVAIELRLGALLGIAFMLGFMQFMFLAMIKSSRPPVEL